MRYSTPVYFVKQGEDVYDYDTGNYAPGQLIRDEVWANVSDMGTQRQTLIFGAIKQGALTVRIQNKVDQPFDYIEIDGQPYNVVSTRTFRHDQAFEMSERL